MKFTSPLRKTEPRGNKLATLLWLIHCRSQMCQCVPIVTKHLQVTNLARIVCEYLPKMTDIQILFEHLQENPFQLTKRVNIKGCRPKSQFRKHRITQFEFYWNYIRISAIRGNALMRSRYCLNYINGSDIDGSDMYAWEFNKYLFTDGLYKSSIRMRDAFIDYIADIYGWKHAMAMYAATMKLHKRVIEILWGCKCRHA